MPDSQQPQKGIDMMVNFFEKRKNLRVLDIGAGMGKWSSLIRGNTQSIHAVEAHAPYIEKFSLRSLYDKVYNQDIRFFNYEEEYDVAILGDVLEHLEYEDAIETILVLKNKVSCILLTIPITICIQDGSVYGNDYETHRYQWSDKEIQQVLGFKLINVGSNDNGLVGIGTYLWNR
tara:strand:+ start:943 stop:1467 length:525 start_codon:yes stop_codon:yes gene_type:complete